jgi:hypothetical protein
MSGMSAALKTREARWGECPGTRLCDRETAMLGFGPPFIRNSER